MINAFYGSREALAKKPPHGGPCSNCGLCCEATLCPLARHLFKFERGPCPALQYTLDRKSICGVMIDPTQYAPEATHRHGWMMVREAARWMIGSGVGCDARFNGEPKNEGFYAFLSQWDRNHYGAIRRARKVFGMKEPQQ